MASRNGWRGTLRRHDRPPPVREGAPPREWALAYLARGWSVVPIHTVGLRSREAPGDAGSIHVGSGEPSCSCLRADCPSAGKHPRIRWEAYTRSRPSAELVNDWFRRWPEANVGVVTGRVSGVIVLDIDPRNAGEASLLELEATVGVLPSTATVLTGGGGRHLWYLSGEAIVPSRPLGPGLDLKGEGGLVVVPPSLHMSGHRYCWVGESAPPASVAPMPPDLHDHAAGGRASVEGSIRVPPIRTTTERTEFAGAWRRAGIEVSPGEAYYLCPFHADHHPSLHIDSDACRWYCFGCRRGGGIGALRAELGEEAQAPRLVGRVRGRVGEARPVTFGGNTETPVVGEAQHQDALLGLTGGRRSFGGVDIEAVADLVPDPAHDGADRPHVLVVIEGRTVGRLRYEDAERLAEAIDDAFDTIGMATCRAIIRGGWDRGGGDVGLFGVVVFT